MKKVNEVLGSEIIMVDGYKELSYEIGNLGSEVLWVCDSNTARMARPLPEPNVILPVGESSKILSSIERIISVASENYFAKDCTFLALGGGVVCDVTALAAALYLRGCNVYFIPTTLVAMADAAIGDFCGVNFKNIKDLIALKYAAKKVIICPECVKSLPEKDFKQGLASILRLSILCKDDSLRIKLIEDRDKILERDLSCIAEVIEKCIEIKKSYIDNNQRWGLNLGLTFSTALLGVAGSYMSEGQTIAWGVCMALQASADLEKCSQSFAKDSIRLFQSYGFEANYRINRGDWIDFKSHLLKKRIQNGNVLNFILIEGQGKPIFGELDEEFIKKTVIAKPNN